MNENINKVADYHKTVGREVLPAPGIPEKMKNVDARLSIIENSVKELEAASYKGDVSGVLSALANLQYALNGAILEFGMQEVIQPAFDELHRSNMSRFCKTTKDAQDSCFKLMGKDIEAYYTLVGKNFVIRDRNNEKLLPGIHHTAPKMRAVLEQFKTTKEK